MRGNILNNKMTKEFKGVFGKNWWSLFFGFKNIRSFFGNDKLIIATDKLVIFYRGKEIVVERSQITEIRDVFLGRAVMFMITNSELPQVLLFYPLFSMGPLNTSTIIKTLKEEGYIN